MFFELSRKRKQKVVENKPLTGGQTTANPFVAPDPFVQDKIEEDLIEPVDEEFSGTEIREYAEKQGMTAGDVWKEIRSGSLVARTENGFVYVYGRNLPPELPVHPEVEEPTVSSNRIANDEPITSGERSNFFDGILPPLPIPVEQEEFERFNYLPVKADDAGVSSPHVALLLDHLKNAKEEQRDIIRLTKESIDRITSMTEKIIEMKDTVLKEQDKVLSVKEDEIQSLKYVIFEKDQENRKLHQQVEDLEMLTKSLTK